MFLVVARNGDVVNKFRQDSMLRALNLKDYLTGLGDYQDVSIFHSLNSGLERDWVIVDLVEA